MSDTVPITPGSGVSVSTEEVTTLNGSTVAAQHLQRYIQALRTADGTAVDIDADNPVPTADADTLAKLAEILAAVDGLEGKDYATQATLAAVLAKLIASPSTEAKQDALIALLPTALSSGRFKVEATGSGTFTVATGTLAGTGRKTVTTAGTRVALASSTAAKWVLATAMSANTGVVVIGDSNVVASVSTRQGTPLNAGDSASLPVSDLANVYIDSTVNGEGVVFTYGS